MAGKGKKWEGDCKKMLMEDFNTPLVFKLINPERIDYFIIPLTIPIRKIILAEAKKTKKDIYYAKADERKREQWKKYFEVKGMLEQIGYKPEVWLYLNKRGVVTKYKFEKYDEIQTSY